MRIEPLGEAALILRELEIPAPEAAALLEGACLGAEDIVPAFDTVGIYFADATSMPDEERLRQAVLGTAAEWTPREHRVSVCYAMGEDLESVGEALGMSAVEIAEEHSAVQYICRAIGFCPGFPYLQRLPDRLAGLPRKQTPRIRVVPGSVAITRDMTAVYPLPRPGGWWLIGRTPLVLADPGDEYFPIRVGDRVRFEPISTSEFEKRQGERL